MIRATVALAVLATASSTPAQEFRTSVRDLFPRIRHARLIANESWIHRFAPNWDKRDDGGYRGFVGESAFLALGERAAKRVQAPTPEEVADCVTVIAGLSESVVVDSQSLRAPAQAGERVSAALRRLRPILAPSIDYEIRLERVEGDACALLLAGRQSVRGNRPTIFADVEEHSRLWSYSVELGAGASISSPLVATDVSGSSVAIRARRYPDGSRALVQAVVRVAEHPPEKGSIAVAHGGLGALDRIETRLGEAALTFVVPRGGQSKHEWTDRDGHTLRLTCKVDWPQPAPTVKGSALLCRDILGDDPIVEFESLARVQHDVDEVDDVDPNYETGGEEVWQRVLRSGHADDLTIVETRAGSGVTVLLGDLAADAAGFASREIEDWLVPIEVVISIFDAPAGTELNLDGETPDGVRQLVRASGMAIAGFTMCFHGGDEQTCLYDWVGEISTNARIPVPRIRTVQSGCTLDLRVHTSEDRRPVSVDLECSLEDLVELSDRTIALNQALVSPKFVSGSAIGPGGGSRNVTVQEVAATGLPQDRVRIEHPRKRSHRIVTSMQLREDGTMELRRSALGFVGAGREVVVMIRATPRD